MQKLVIIGANEFQLPLIIRAKQLGYETHVFAWEEGAVGKAYADIFYPISITELDCILSICKEIHPAGVCSIGSDLAAITVNYLGRSLALQNYNTEQCVRKSTNKFAMRQALYESGLLTPYFKQVSSVQELADRVVPFPLIVKPTDRSGSRAVTKVTDMVQLGNAIEVAVQSSFEKKAIIEGLILGDEFSCECISHQGRHKFLAVTKKFTTGAPHYIETGHIEPSGLDAKALEEVKRQVFQALDALEITFGASHAEFRLGAGGQLQFIEIAARMGGDCIGSDLVALSTGYDFIKMVIDVAVGNPPDDTIYPHHDTAIIRFVVGKSDLLRLEHIKKTAPEALFRISDIAEVTDGTVIDSGSRFGYYILTATRVQTLALREAAGLL